MAKSPSPVCWMDAGNVVAKPLHALRAILQSEGFYLPASAGVVARWTHPAMLSALGIPQERFATRPNLNAACVAFEPVRSDIRTLVFRTLVFRWAELAKRREVIGPEGSSRSNHRYDQALLTVLAYHFGILEHPSQAVDEVLIHPDIDRRPRTVIAKR